MPQLGDANTPIEEVDAFYDFWYEFKSWRILTGNPKEEGDGEHDLEDAEDAYERRWMKTENERERKRLKKQHMKTIAELRDLAFKRDPRVQAAKAAEFARVEAEKKAKLEAKQKKEAEEKAIADANKTPQELDAMNQEELLVTFDTFKAIMEGARKGSPLGKRPPAAEA